MEFKEEEIKKAIIEEIKEDLKWIERGKHKDHELTCIVNLIINYKNGNIELEDIEVIQADCETCRHEDGTPYCLWE